MSTPQVPTAYAHFEGPHTHEWRRFTITARNHGEAAHLAAALGWWLHCWQWVAGETEPTITEHTPPAPHDTWEAFVEAQDQAYEAARQKRERS